MVDQEDPTPAQGRRPMGTLKERADRLNAAIDLRVEEGEIGMAFKRQRLRMMHEIARKPFRKAALSHVFRAKKTVGSRWAGTHAREERTEVGMAAKGTRHTSTP